MASLQSAFLDSVNIDNENFMRAIRIKNISVMVNNYLSENWKETSTFHRNTSEKTQQKQQQKNNNNKTNKQKKKKKRTTENYIYSKHLRI